ncbi:MAG: stage III sporulation protein AF [Bacillota bacterium]
MIEFLKNWVLNIVTLTVFIMLIEILVPSGKMKRVVNLVTGLILVIALINPVLGLFSKGINLNEFQITDSNYIDKREIMINSEILKENQIKQITNVYRKKVINQLESITKEVKGVGDVNADVIINEDYTSENFGEVKKVYLTLDLYDGTKGIKPVLSVKKVQIGNSEAKDDLEHSVKQLDKKIKNQLEDKIERLLNVQKENIVISLKEN